MTSRRDAESRAESRDPAYLCADECTAGPAGGRGDPARRRCHHITSKDIDFGDDDDPLDSDRHSADAADELSRSSFVARRRSREEVNCDNIKGAVSRRAELATIHASDELCLPRARSSIRPSTTTRQCMA